MRNSEFGIAFLAPLPTPARSAQPFREGGPLVAVLCSAQRILLESKDQAKQGLDSNQHIHKHIETIFCSQENAQNHGILWDQRKEVRQIHPSKEGKITVPTLEIGLDIAHADPVDPFLLSVNAPCAFPVPGTDEEVHEYVPKPHKSNSVKQSKQYDQ